MSSPWLGRHQRRALCPRGAARAGGGAVDPELARQPAGDARFSARRLGLRASTAEFVLPLAVVIFRATSAAMNLAVVYYIAALAGIEVTPLTRSRLQAC
jgi:hypothetical protein